MEFLKSVIAKFIDKKTIIGWVSAALLAAGAVAVKMDQKDLKEAVCGAPILKEVQTK